MRSVLFVSAVPDFRGGAEQSLLDLLANDKIVAHVAAPMEGPISEYCSRNGILFHPLTFGKIGDIRRPLSPAAIFESFLDLIAVSNQLGKIVKHNYIDIIHTNGFKPHVIGAVLRMMNRKHKVVMHFRDIPYTKTENIVWFILSIIASSVVLVSRYCLPHSERRKAIHVISNGTNLGPDFSKNILSERVIRVGFVGRIHPHKGLHILLRWVATARKGNVNCILSVRGEFSKEDAEYKSLIDATIKELFLQEYVQFDGYIKDRAELYDRLDIVCAPSQAAEPFGRVAIEAMAHGLIVVTTPSGGFLGIIEDGVSGFFANSEEEFYAILQLVKNAPDKALNIAQTGRARCKSEFSIEALHLKINDVYDSV